LSGGFELGPGGCADVLDQLDEAGFIASDEVKVAIAFPVCYFHTAVATEGAGHALGHHNVGFAFVRNVSEPAAHGGGEDAVFGCTGDGEAVRACIGDALRWLSRVGPFDDASGERPAAGAAGTKPFTIALRGGPFVVDGFAVQRDWLGFSEAIFYCSVTVESVFENLRRKVLDAHVEGVEVAVDEPHAVGEVSTVFGPYESWAELQGGVALIEVKLESAFAWASADTTEEIGVAVVVPVEGLVAGVVVVDRLVVESETLCSGVAGLGIGADVFEEEDAPPRFAKGGGVDIALEDVDAAVFVPIDSDRLVVFHANGEWIEAVGAVVVEGLLGFEDDCEQECHAAVAHVC